MPQTATDTLDITRIRADGGTQMRAEISEERVCEYADLLDDGAAFPPVVVYHDGTDHWLADGFHRLAAFERAEQVAIPAIIHAGTREDAIRFALRANADNGQPRSKGDLQRCYQAAVDNGFCEPHDTAAVKALLRCGPSWARTLTKDARDARNASLKQHAALLAEQGKTQREIGKVLGVDQKTVCNWLEEKRRSGVFPQNDQPEPQPTPAASAPQAPAPAPPAHTEPAPEPVPEPAATEPPPRPEPDPDEIADLDRQINEKLQQLADMKADSARRKAHNEARFQQDAALQARDVFGHINSWLGMILEVIERHEARGHAITPDARDREKTLRLLDQFTTFLERALP